ncbi:MAG: MFS transporter, partial [bacterium]|nr:MFS transporter [bacterium]
MKRFRRSFLTLAITVDLLPPLEKVITPVDNPPSVGKSRLVSATPFFYGWVILAAGVLGLCMTSPGQTYSISIFIEHFINDLGLSRSIVSTLYMVGTLTASFVLPVVGRLIDRRGSRLMTVIISLVFGLACLYMGLVRNALMLGIGFFALRTLGQGSLSLVSKLVVNQWWVRRRGFAIGVVGMTYALIGRAGFPVLINWLIPMIGWRGTYALLGLMLVLGMAPVGWLLVRNQPESYGLRPDGEAPIDRESESNPAPSWSEDHWTLAEVLRAPAFWILAAGFSSISMLSTGLTFHLVSIYVDNGLTPTIAASAFVPIAITSAVAQLGCGMLLDRVPARFLLALSLVMHAILLVGAPYLRTVHLALGFGVLMGAAGGLQQTISSSIWAMYFGRRHLGEISGATTTISMASSAMGPML